MTSLFPAASIIYLDAPVEEPARPQPLPAAVGACPEPWRCVRLPASLEERQGDRMWRQLQAELARAVG